MTGAAEPMPVDLNTEGIDIGTSPGSPSHSHFFLFTGHLTSPGLSVRISERRGATGPLDAFMKFYAKRLNPPPTPD